MRSEMYAPKNAKLPEGLVLVTELTDDIVKFCSHGGGWLKSAHPDTFFEQFRKVEKAELEAIEYRPALFDIEDYYGDRPAKGFTRGMRWNGWACPVFAQEGIDRIREVFGDEIRYDEERDVLIFDLGEDVDDDCRFEEYEGFDIFVGGEIKRVYAIGSGAWVWDEVQPNDDQ